MGFQITFVPSEEKMTVYKPWNENTVNYGEAIKNSKREIISYCLKNPQYSYHLYQKLYIFYFLLTLQHDLEKYLP